MSQLWHCFLFVASYMNYRTRNSDEHLYSIGIFQCPHCNNSRTAYTTSTFPFVCMCLELQFSSCDVNNALFAADRRTDGRQRGPTQRACSRSMSRCACAGESIVTPHRISYIVDCDLCRTRTRFARAACISRPTNTTHAALNQPISDWPSRNHRMSAVLTRLCH